MHVAAIIAAGGRGLRVGSDQPKQLLAVAGIPMLRRSLDAIAACDVVTSLVVALPAELIANPPDYLLGASKPLRLVTGGATRRDSVAAAFATVDPAADVVLVHDAARPFVTDAVIRRTVAAAYEHGAAIAAVGAHDTVKQVHAQSRVVTGTLQRESIVMAQTPQAFRTGVLTEALKQTGDATDEAALAERAGYAVHVVDGDPRNMKITTAEDFAMAEDLLAPRTSGAGVRIGHGYDLHTLTVGRPLVLGGVTVPFERGLLGHSDADVVCHALTDAILGAVGAGDIGRHFPDTDATWRDADSIELLRKAVAIVRARGFAVANADVTVIAQRPKLAPFVDAMRARLADALGCAMSDVSVKGKTNEGVDSMGAGQSIAAHAVALVARA